MKDNDQKSPANLELKGNTLRVYIYVLKNGPSELREIQHSLGFSTASLASYHLGKLLTSGYVNQDERGRYVALRDVSSQVLEGYTRIGVAIVPQFLFLALVFSILVGFFSYESYFVSHSFILYLIIVSIAAVALIWFETLRLWRKLVTWQ